MDVGKIGGTLFDPALASLAASENAASLAATSASQGVSSSRAAAQKFESLFATLLVKEMRKALPEGFFGSEATGDIYGGWLDQTLGQAIAKRGGLHLAPLVEESLQREGGGA